MNRIKTILFALLFFSAGYLMSQPLTITKNVTQMTCNNNFGSVSLSVSGGLAPYTYHWLQNDIVVFGNSNVATNLPPGGYFVVVTDANDEIATDTFSITNGVYGYFTNITDAVCPLSNGSAKVAVEGGQAPYTYAWSNGSTTETVSGLAGNTKLQVEVTDANRIFITTTPLL